VCDGITKAGIRCRRNGYCWQHSRLRQMACRPATASRGILRRVQLGFFKGLGVILLGAAGSVVGAFIYAAIVTPPNPLIRQAKNSSDQIQLAAVVTSPQPLPIANRPTRTRIAAPTTNNVSSASATSSPSEQEAVTQPVYACPTNPATNNISGLASQAAYVTDGTFPLAGQPSGGVVSSLSSTAWGNPISISGGEPTFPLASDDTETRQRKFAAMMAENQAYMEKARASGLIPTWETPIYLADSTAALKNPLALSTANGGDAIKLILPANYTTAPSTTFQQITSPALQNPIQSLTNNTTQ
jgi:hypothetical protein